MADEQTGIEIPKELQAEMLRFFRQAVFRRRGSEDVPQTNQVKNPIIETDDGSGNHD